MWLEMGLEPQDESREGAEKELFNLSGIRFGLLVLVWIMGLQFLLVHLF